MGGGGANQPLISSLTTSNTLKNSNPKELSKNLNKIQDVNQLDSNHLNELKDSRLDLNLKSTFKKSNLDLNLQNNSKIAKDSKITKKSKLQSLQKVSEIQDLRNLNQLKESKNLNKIQEINLSKESKYPNKIQMKSSKTNLSKISISIITSILLSQSLVALPSGGKFDG